MKMKSEFKKISIIGLGLIGTSILHAINAKQRFNRRKICIWSNENHFMRSVYA